MPEQTLWRPATREVRITGGRDYAATAAWAASRRGRPRKGASLCSPTGGWRLWVECGRCHTGYALRPHTSRSDLQGSSYARWVTACAACGWDVVLWTGSRWAGELAYAG